MDPTKDLADSLHSLSLDKSDLPRKSFNSLHKPHVQIVPGQFQFSNDFLQPISVKSNQWNRRKVDVQNLQASKGPFAKYASKHVISPPSVAKTVLSEQLPPAVLPVTQENNSIEEIVAGVADEADKIKTKEIIEELLKPTEYPNIKIDPKDKVIPGLNTELYDHQVLGLKFLLTREKEKPKERDYIRDLDELSQEGKKSQFFNVGGILADDMGLGKTVQIIALLLQNKLTETQTSGGKTTLIVCPASLISQWCTEIETKAPSLSVLSYHGPKRPSASNIVHKYDVVLTSYPTLSSENSKKSSPLFDPKYPFWRVILDEAHTIKNSETKSHISCCNIIAQRRWCLTGTPIQNKLEELYSLFRFLGVNKYENYEIWKVRISYPLSSGNPEDAPKALKRLRSMLDKFMLRRTKQVLIDNHVLTVRKTIHRETLDFTPFERKLYDKLEKKIIQNILGHDVAVDETNSGTLQNRQDIDLSYMSILTYLLRLRQLCCHWELLFNLTQHCDDDSLMTEIKSGLKESKSEKDITDKELDDALIDDDFNGLLDSMKNMTIDSNKVPSKGQVEEVEEREEDKEGNLRGDTSVQFIYAIKLQRTLNILKKDDENKPRKTIIFSEFTSMLDILSKFLFENGIEFVRYDGKMDKQSKDNALRSLNENPKIHVLLCSLKCGAYGLNITSCSRVILYEPFWNPAIGAQAIDRAYRIGQLSDVDVHEFYISDTIEIRIRQLQDKKRELMKAVVDKDVKSAVKLIGNGLSRAELLGLLGLNEIT